MSERPSRKELSEIRLGLKADGNNICYGELCNGKIKEISDFVKNQNYCYECNRERGKQTQKKNMRANKRVKFKLKFGKKCEKCECSDIDMLEFDHIYQVQNKNADFHNVFIR